jgi:drug/metabolite transporter (DMT)-like permease
LRNDRQVWGAFIILAITWGTSFLFIKVGLRTLQPLTLVSFRLLIGAVGLLFILRLTKQRIPRDRMIWRNLAILGTINTAIPFVLITWAESGAGGIDSAVASVLNSAVPLFTIVISGAILRIEKVTAGRVAGLLVGFFGVILMLSRGLGGGNGSIAAHVAVIIASLCYATSSVFARRHFPDTNPVVVATGQIIVATLIVMTFALIAEDQSQQSWNATTLFSLLWLGLLGSCVAYILYFFVLKRWGPTRTTLVTYLLPIVGVTAGVILLDEILDWRLLVGGALILSGIALVNWRPKRDLSTIEFQKQEGKI